MIDQITFSKVLDERLLFQTAIVRHDWETVYSYLKILFDDVSYDDEAFVFALRDEWGITTLDFLMVTLTICGRFCFIKTFQKDEAFRILKQIRKAIIKRGYTIWKE